MTSTERFGGSGGDGGGPKRTQGLEGALQVGAVLQNRYKITGVLGVGGMGSVYQSRDMHFPNAVRYVAVKEMLNLASDPTLREMTLKNFEREANILAELTHSAIPKIYDYFSSKDRAYLVMEYINGKDLEAVINSVPDHLPLDIVLKWALELCDVLNYLHTQEPPIIFRDMKPSNVMIDQQGNVRLIDFGIAKAFQSGGQKGTMIGTEGYSPPEQYRGDASPAGDIYALGATLHHLLTRRDPRLEPPFSFNERPIRQANPKVSTDLDAVVMHALNYDPKDRYPTAGAMKDAIANLNKVVIVSVGGAGSGAAPAGAAAEESFDGYTDTTASGIAPLWKFKCEDEIRSTPLMHRGVVYVGTYDNNMYAINAADGSFKWKFATEGGIVGTPGIAADEGFIVFGSEDSTLYAVNLITGKIQWTFQTKGPIRSSINVQLGIAFFGSDDGKLYAVRLSTGRLAWQYDAGREIRSRPAVTSERIVFGVESGDFIGLDLAGAIKWRFKTRRGIASSPIIQDDIAYFGSSDAHIYAVDIKQGWGLWNRRTGKPVVGSPIIAGKNLFIGSADGYMYALDYAQNGKEVWKFQTGDQVVSTPAFVNGNIYFGGVDKKVYCLDAKKGKMLWEFETGGPITSTATIVDGVLYIGSTDQYLYALKP